MNDKELINIWKSYDQKLDQVLVLNKQITYDLTKKKLNKTINKMKYPIKMMLFIGAPYTLLLFIITFIAFKSGGFFVCLGFGTISIIMAIVFGRYLYHLKLIADINRHHDIVVVQEKMSRLKLSVFNSTKLAIVQIPFWVICWMSLDALKNAPLLYGGVNAIIFLSFSIFAYWLFKNISIQKKDSKVSSFFLSGSDWDPLIKSASILDQLKEYQSVEFKQ